MTHAVSLEYPQPPLIGSGASLGKSASRIALGVSAVLRSINGSASKGLLFGLLSVCSAGFLYLLNKNISSSAIMLWIQNVVTVSSLTKIAVMVSSLSCNESWIVLPSASSGGGEIVHLGRVFAFFMQWKKLVI